jgi:dethiobiotin synthetase
MQKQYFISGTDTDVGKTLISVALVKAAQAAGYTAIGLKPVSAGCEKIDGMWKNDDALQLQAVSDGGLSYAQINPLAFKEFMAPHIAAENTGTAVSATDLCNQIAAVPAADVTFIEGAGGWLVPLNDTETMADIAIALKTPVILVVGLRLGCINHSLLSVAAIRAAGLQLAGWVANSIDPDMEVRAENIRSIEQRIGAPLLGTVPYMQKPDAAQAASLLNLALLA